MYVSCTHSLLSQDLVKRLKKDVNGNFEHLVVNMFRTNVEMFARHIHGAIHRTRSTDYKTLVEIVVTLSTSNDLKKQVIQRYSESEY